MDVDDLWRMLGWEFSLMVATVRLINSGLLDELPSLKIRVSHFGGGIARYLPRIRGLQDREKSDTAKIPRHSRTPREAFDHYLQHRLYYDCAGWSGPDFAAERGAEWARIGFAELPSSQVLFATDYPQAVRDEDEITAYVKAVAELGAEARKILDGANAEQLIPNLKDRLNRAPPESRPPG
jgi:predicted TIM-barrel fold metal-dependent hydrolase